MMKSQLCFSVLLCVVNTVSYSKEDSLKQLNPQISTAESTHVTTRIEWLKFPQFQYNDTDLKDRERHVIVRIKADENGKVTDATIQESSGVKKLDQIILKAVFAAKTKPFIKNGDAQGIIGYQAFSLKPNQQQNANDTCIVTGLSKNWERQQKDKSIAFEYTQPPKIEINQDILKHQNRSVKVKFKVNHQGDVQELKLKKLSGVNELDQNVIEAVSKAQVRIHRSARTLWIYKKSSLTDTIKFNVKDCQPMPSPLK